MPLEVVTHISDATVLLLYYYCIGPLSKCVEQVACSIGSAHPPLGCPVCALGVPRWFRLHGASLKNPLGPLISSLRLPLYKTSEDNSVLYDHDLERCALGLCPWYRWHMSVVLVVCVRYARCGMRDKLVQCSLSRRRLECCLHVYGTFDCFLGFIPYSFPWLHVLCAPHKQYKILQRVHC